MNKFSSLFMSSVMLIMLFSILTIGNSNNASRTGITNFVKVNLTKGK